jgi:hypothetical protein
MNTNNQYPKPVIFPYKDFLYKYNFESKKFKVLPYKYKPNPSTLFKYYALDLNSIDSLINSYIYVSHPEQLNDVYDSSEHLLIFDDETTNKNILKDSSLSELQKKEIFNDNNFLSRANKEIIFSKLGIFSMTETPDNRLIWAHYTKNRGFAIEFNFEKLRDSSTGRIHGQFPMNYVDKIEPIHLSKIDFRCALLMQSNIKHLDWAYENEWRLLVECRDGEYQLPNPELQCPNAKERKSYYSDIKAIESVWLATKFFEEGELFIVIEQNTGYIRLKGQNIGFKSLLLSFVADKEIKTFIRLQNGVNIKKIECYILKKCNCSFKLDVKELL